MTWNSPAWTQAAIEYRESNGGTIGLPLLNDVGDYNLRTGTSRSPEITLIPFNQIQLGTQRRDLVKGLIPRVGLTVLWGPPKCGKSFWAFDVMMHVALGWDYRSRRVHQGPVVYCAFEGASGYGQRAQAFRQRHLQDHEDDVPFFLMPVPLDLFGDRDRLIAAIRRELGDETPVSVTLDTLNRSIRGSESSDQDMSNYVKAADAIRAAFKCAMLVVHHCGVNGDRPRGHTSLTGAADAQLAAKRDAANNVVVTVEWVKDGPEGQVITSALEVETVGVDEDGEPLTSCVVVPATAQPTGKAVPPPTAKRALELLREAIDEQGAPGRTNGRCPADAKTVPIKLWKSYYVSGTGTHSDNPDSKRRAFDRAVERLQQLQLIGVWNDVVWLP
jgi:AAA domain